MVNLPHNAPCPRLCLLQKDTISQEYGYNLHAEKGRGQFVGTVDTGSIADKSGLRLADRIFAVNGVVIKGENHKKVVERIKADPMCCELLVLDENGAEWYKKHNIEITPNLPNIIRMCKEDARNKNINSSPPPTTWYAPQNNNNSKEGAKVAPVFVAPPPPSDHTMKPRPRLCHLHKSAATDEFGFNLHAEKGRGHFIGTVDANGIGDKAGLRMGQRIVGVNGELVYPTTPHKEVVGYIKRSPLSTSLLVASEEVDKWYKDQGEEYSFDYVEDYGESETAPPLPKVSPPLSPHKIQVNRDDEGIAHMTPPSPAPRKVEEEPANTEPDNDETAEETIARRMTLEVINSVYAEEPVKAEDPVPTPAQRSIEQEVRFEPAPPVDSANLLDLVFSQVALPQPDVEPQAVLQAQEPEPEPEQQHVPQYYDAYETVEEHSVPTPDYQEEHQYGNVPANEYYMPQPVAVPQTTTILEREQNGNSAQISPVSQNSSGYGHSDSSLHNGHARDSREEFSIYNLSAKEARERLRNNKRNQRNGVDMSLEDKYRLVSNM